MSSHPYDALLPDLILDAIDAIDNGRYRTSGSMLALNSYENRVYQVGLEEGRFIVAKFYRPGRWSDEAILEEHAFAAQLAAVEVPVIAPLADDNGETLHRYEGFRFALFERHGGRWPELDDPDTLYRLGQFLGRIHAVGAARPFEQRPALTPESFGEKSLAYLMGKGFLPREYEQQYRDLAEGVLAEVAQRFAGVDFTPIRLHGDFHPGNILWTDTGAHLVDLDDCRSGPAVQDLWMLLSGDVAQMNAQLSELLEGYEEFFDFSRRELSLIEPLRTLRLLHYSAWLARRWDDPAFQQAFPWFNTVKYWEEQVLTLREQQQRLTLPPLLSS